MEPVTEKTPVQAPAKARLNFEKLEAQLREWGVDLEKFRTKAQKKGADLKAEYDKQSKVLGQKLDDARAKLQEVKRAGHEATSEMEKGVEAAWADLKQAFAAATKKFK